MPCRNMTRRPCRIVFVSKGPKPSLEVLLYELGTLMALSEEKNGRLFHPGAHILICYPITKKYIAVALN